ncbi:MAG TPA: NADH-quinone oxidoreductase subunit L [Actinomycetota bacterium]|nr:NADH-quinone oxidoreductase subunit L [Actinomycetota bacterium]
MVSQVSLPVHTSGVFVLMWLVPALPLAGAAINLFFGRRTGRSSGVIATVAMAGAFVVALALLVGVLGRDADQRVVLQHLWSWIPVGTLQVGIDFRVDPLSIVMMLVVTGVGSLIHLYSIGYMKGDPREPRFFAELNLFVAFMLLLVMADNFVLLYLGWEGVGLCSYLLIGHYFERPAAAAAAKKAFVVTRVGDAAMLVGLALIFATFGSLSFGQTIGTSQLASGGRFTPLIQVPSQATYTAIALLLLAGAVGKSAQIPLQVWLADAMEGPTPVSALIHAATMVTAGVYLVVRTHIFFEISGTALVVVTVIGVLTALYGATSALGQDDIKRVLAYSTMSQIGYMFFAAGLKAYSIAIFLLVAHAFYKAVLFLGAGSIMHALDGEVDLKRMGGLRKAMPITFATFVVGWLCIAGIPPLSGFFAKDEILAVADHTGRVFAWLVALAAAFFSALYISRVVFLAFFGPLRHDTEPHESPPVMTIPMILLALGAIFGGVLGLTEVNGVLPKFLEPVTGPVPEATGGLSTPVLIVISIVVALLGIGLGWLIWGSGRIDWVALRGRFRRTHATLEHGWWFDSVYGAVLVAPGKAASAFAAYVVDRRVIDGAGNLIAKGFGDGSNLLRRVGNGMVRRYALFFLAGVVGILWYLAARF